MNKEELWNKCKELEDKYYSICDNCGPGNGCDDCRYCDKGDEKGKIYKELSSIKRELKDKYNLDYDGFKKLSNVLKKDDIYNDWKESQKNNLKLYTQADLKKKDEEIENLKNKYLYLQADQNSLLNTYNSLLKLLGKYEVKLIYEDERPVFFNSEYDEAITSVKTDDPKLDNSIHKIYKKGFFFKDKILRFEKVIVNKYEA